MIRTAPAYVVPTRAALAAARAALYRARPIFLVNGPVKLSLGTFPGDFPAAAHTALRAHGRWVRRLARDGCWTITMAATTAGSSVRFSARVRRAVRTRGSACCLIDRAVRLTAKESGTRKRRESVLPIKENTMTTKPTTKAASPATAAEQPVPATPTAPAGFVIEVGAGAAPVDEGAYGALIAAVIDLGVQQPPPGGKGVPRRQLAVGFELLGATSAGVDLPEPPVMFRRYTLSFGPKAELPKLLRAVLLREPVPGERLSPAAWIGKAVTVTVEHTQRMDGSTSARVASLTRNLGEGVTAAHGRAVAVPRLRVGGAARWRRWPSRGPCTSRPRGRRSPRTTTPTCRVTPCSRSHWKTCARLAGPPRWCRFARARSCPAVPASVRWAGRHATTRTPSSPPRKRPAVVRGAAQPHRRGGARLRRGGPNRRRGGRGTQHRLGAARAGAAALQGGDYALRGGLPDRGYRRW